MSVPRQVGLNRGNAFAAANVTHFTCQAVIWADPAPLSLFFVTDPG